MKLTRKFVAGLKTAATLMDYRELNQAKHDNESLYAALNQRGYFWDADAGEWSDQHKSTSIFETDQGLPTGEFRLRVMAHPGEIEEVVKAVQEGLHQWGIRITEVSGHYPNRRGPGVRVYVTCQIAR